MNQLLEVRVRFAPSPTGHLHIGGLRTAIFNWLFARHHQGTFLLRIEDTDLERSKPEYLDAIIDAMSWMSMTSDEDLVIQSSRIEAHKHVAQQLLDEGKAYRCFCSEEDLESLKESQRVQGKTMRYDGRCRDKKISTADAQKPHTIRFRLPFDQGPISFDDGVYGTIAIDAQQLDDFIIVRSDGMPMYNFVVVVDDAAMRITHVIRGQEHVANTPKQILLYQACGYKQPVFAHIPLILGPSGDKLSKRDGAVSVLDYRADGYLPEALFNYLVRLGWSHHDQEIFKREELIELFSLAGVHKKGAIFDKAKLDWVNGMYMRAAPDQDLLSYATQHVEPSLSQTLSSWSLEQQCKAVALYKDRAKTLKELAHEIINLQQPTFSFSEQSLEPFVSATTVTILDSFIQKTSPLSSFDAAQLSSLGKQVCHELSITLAALAQPLRRALIGNQTSPGVFELLALLGKDEGLRRITAFRNFLQSIIERARS